MIKALLSPWEKPGIPLALALFVFFAAVAPIGCLRPLWYDEIVTAWFGEASSFATVLQRYMVGAEPSPPLYLLLSFLSVQLFGQSEWALRFPSFAGFAVGLIFLYRFTARRLGPSGGAAAIGLILITEAVYYAQESRPYGAVVGCIGVAIWAWQNYADTRSRRHLTICCLALFIASSLHYYSVLIGVPFGLAWVFRCWRARRMDWGFAVCAIVPAIPLALHYPFIRLILATQSNPRYAWSKPTYAFPAKYWLHILQPGLLAFVALLILIVLIWQFSKQTPIPAESNPLPGEEMALLIGFILLPFAGVVLAKLVTNAIAPRYVICAVFGYAAIGAHVLMRITPGWQHAAVLLLLAFAAGNGALELRWMLREPKPGQLPAPAVSGEPTLPIVVDDYLLFSQLGRYGSADLASRIVYLTDKDRLTRYTTAGQMELITVNAVRVGQFKGRSDYLEPFLASHRRFLLFEPLRADSNESFLSRDLLDRGVPLQVISLDGGRWYLVDVPSR